MMSCRSEAMPSVICSTAWSSMRSTFSRSLGAARRGQDQLQTGQVLQRLVVQFTRPASAFNFRRLDTTARAILSHIATGGYGGCAAAGERVQQPLSITENRSHLPPDRVRQASRPPSRGTPAARAAPPAHRFPRRPSRCHPARQPDAPPVDARARPLPALLARPRPDARATAPTRRQPHRWSNARRIQVRGTSSGAPTSARPRLTISSRIRSRWVSSPTARATASAASKPATARWSSSRLLGRIPVHACVFDGKAGPFGEHDQRLLVLRGELASCLSVRYRFPNTESRTRTGHRGTWSSVVAGRESVRSRVAADIRQSQRPWVRNQHPQDAVPLRQVPDPGAGLLIEAQGQELL